MSFDFLPNMNQNVGGGLNAQLARLGQVQRMQPLVGIAQTQAFITPITKMMQDAQANIVQGMIQYNEANPDLDDSLLFDGTETILNTQLQENNVKFKELNRKLGFMSPTSKNYAETVKEINNINKSNLNLRDQNKKLLDIRNIIKDKDLQEISQGNSSAHLKMYEDIQQGRKDNFSTDAEGNLIWNNPNKQGEIKSIPISGVSADGPEMTQGAANDQAYNTFATIRQIRANELQPGDAYQRINTMAREIGDSGLKSLIFDNMNAANSPIGNTDKWWKTYAASVGVEPESEAGGKLLEQIKLKGMLHSVGGVKVKDHFLNWLKEEAVKAPKFGKGLPPKGNGNESTDPAATPWKEWGASYSSQYIKTGGADEVAPISITWQDASERRTRLDNLDIVKGAHAVYRYQPKDENDKNPWKSSIDFVIEGKTKSEFTMFEVADIEGLIKMGEGRADFEGDIAGRKSDQDKINAGLAPSTALKENDDDAASGELNRIFGMRMGESEYYFHPFTRDIFGGGGFKPGSSDNVFTNDVMLVKKDGINKLTGVQGYPEAVVDEATGQPYRFKTGTDYKEEQLTILNDLMKQLDYVKNITGDTDKSYEDKE